ncbi:hypothetical protein T492DRAFT_963002 [Pavlovales sp. CCMP2436]|nr:hypothetical protein T492DRAFT_963002 [Pavlovales sp. CCMP2436]
MSWAGLSWLLGRDAPAPGIAAGVAAGQTTAASTVQATAPAAPTAALAFADDAPTAPAYDAPAAPAALTAAPELTALAAGPSETAVSAVAGLSAAASRQSPYDEDVRVVVYRGKDRVAAQAAFDSHERGICGPASNLIPDGPNRWRCTFRSPPSSCDWRCKWLEKDVLITILCTDTSIPHFTHVHKVGTDSGAAVPLEALGEMQLITPATFGLSISTILTMAEDETNPLSLSPSTKKTMSRAGGKRPAKGAYGKMIAKSDAP